MTTSIEVFDSKIIIHYPQQWFQEDITTLYQQLFSKIVGLSIQEIIQGADRESIRFTWLVKHYFILNFDCYSQSIWIEGEDQASIEEIPALYNAFAIV